MNLQIFIFSFCIHLIESYRHQNSRNPQGPFITDTNPTLQQPQRSVQDQSVLTWQEQQEQPHQDLDEKFTFAEYDLDKKRWICPRKKPELPPDIKSESLFSLDAAKILNNAPNRTNWKELYYQVTGIHIDLDDITKSDSSSNLNSNNPVAQMGVVRNRIGPIRDRNNRNNSTTDNSTFEYIPQAIPAGCTPENITVPLNQSSDPNVFIWPNCIRIERCGGCCNHDLLQCQPREIEMKKFKVTQTTLQGATYNLVGQKVVEIEIHKSCQCDCKIKEENCNDRQYYVPNLCRCQCSDKMRKEHVIYVHMIDFGILISANVNAKIYTNVQMD